MKIGMVCYPTYGGSGVVATELGTELARRGHEVHFISYEPPARFTCCVEGLWFHEVEMISYPLFRHPPYLLAMASKMAEVAQDAALDLIHVHYAIPHTISASLARDILGRCDIAIVTTLHGTDITIVGREPAYFPVVQFALRDSDGVTAVSRSLADETRETFRHDGHIEVIPNFVDPERFCPGAGGDSRGRFAAPDEKLLAHVSNFRPVKNPTDVVRVFARVAAEVRARLVMVGDGPEVSLSRELAYELGVGDRARFLGETPDVARVLACADLFLLPSSQESFGLAALEAMACGVPVIATRVGGLPEVVSDGETGFLFGPGDVDGMADSAVKLLGSEQDMRRMGDAARARAIERFTPGEIVPRYEEFYKRVLALTRESTPSSPPAPGSPRRSMGSP
jgi:N-acetyl-alpha-D-glucosaminyl L-malate synthase BshA